MDRSSRQPPSCRPPVAAAAPWKRPQRHGALQRRLTPRLPSPRFFSRVPSPRCCSLARFPSLWASSAMASSAMRGGLGPTAAASVPKEDDELEVGLCLGSKKQQPPSPASCLILTTRDLQPGPLSPDSSVSSSSPAAPPPPPRREQWLSDTHRVVGWPPIRTFRMNNLFNQAKDNASDAGTKKAADDPNVQQDKEETKKKGRVIGWVKVNTALFGQALPRCPPRPSRRLLIISSKQGESCSRFDFIRFTRMASQIDMRRGILLDKPTSATTVVHHYRFSSQMQC